MRSLLVETVDLRDVQVFQQRDLYETVSEIGYMAWRNEVPTSSLAAAMVDVMFRNVDVGLDAIGGILPTTVDLPDPPGKHRQQECKQV